MTTSSFKADLNLALATLSFAICFAAWGLMSALAPYFRDLLHLDATQTALLVVVPVVQSSLARIPIRMLADRDGGRATFTRLMLVVAVLTALVATA
jgi:MFS transporter, NNP family, nitrate/nitrite transporter